MDVCSHRNIVSSHHQHLITPKNICSHHQFSRSHRHNFVHTMKMLITLLKILFTPSKFCSHHLFSGSHRNNFVHTIKILFTLWKFWVTPYVVQNMQTSHLFALFTHGWYDRHTQSLKSSLCGVTELCFGTKQIHLGVITSDECKNAPRTSCPSLVTQHGMDGGVFSHTVHALVQLT